MKFCGRCCPSSHPECPERVTAIVGMMETEGLLSRCVRVEVRNTAPAHVSQTRHIAITVCSNTVTVCCCFVRVIVTENV